MGYLFSMYSRLSGGKNEWKCSFTVDVWDAAATFKFLSWNCPDSNVTELCGYTTYDESFDDSKGNPVFARPQQRTYYLLCFTRQRERYDTLIVCDSQRFLEYHPNLRSLLSGKDPKMKLARCEDYPKGFDAYNFQAARFSDNTEEIATSFGIIVFDKRRNAEVFVNTLLTCAGITSLYDHTEKIKKLLPKRDCYHNFDDTSSMLSALGNMQAAAAGATNKQDDEPTQLQVMKTEMQHLLEHVPLGGQSDGSSDSQISGDKFTGSTERQSQPGRRRLKESSHWLKTFFDKECTEAGIDLF